MRAGKNAFDGYAPSVPEGEKLDYCSDSCNELETLGEPPAARAQRPHHLWPHHSSIYICLPIHEAPCTLCPS